MRVIKCDKKFRSKKTPARSKFFTRSSGNILKIFLNFTNFEPYYSYKIYSYKKKSVPYFLCNTTEAIPSGAKDNDCPMAILLKLATTLIRYYGYL